MSPRVPALAVDEQTEYTTVERTLHPNDAIIMCTDRLFEVANKNGKELGQKRLLDLANQHREQTLRDLFPMPIDEIRSFALGGKLYDDACLVGCRLARILER